MVRTILTMRNISNFFFLEAVNQVLNRRPTLVVKTKALEEAWSDKRLDVSHFEIFGCIAYAHIPNQQGSKLDNREVK